MARKYTGPVVFGSDGVHYPATSDGSHDTSRPLRSDGEGGWRDAAKDDALHNDANHESEVTLPVGGEG